MIDQEKWFIFTAVRQEARAIDRALVGRRLARPQILPIGIAAVGLPRHLRQDQVAGIIMAGLAGALDPNLKLGDIVIDSDGAAILPKLPSYHYGCIHTAAELAGGVARKSELFQRTGALAVEMENALVRDFAAGLGVPFVGIRAILDTAGEELDPAVLRLVDPWGRPQPLTLAGDLLKRPGLLWRLNRLASASRRACRSLGSAVCEMVDWLSEPKNH